ncbi:MAG: glycosyltransferase family 4 protein [Armatimonadota bacterium]
MKILYVSSILTVHDARFLEKLASKYDTYLVTFIENNIPDNIRDIKGLTVFHLPTEYFIFTPRDNIFTKIRKTITYRVNILRKKAFLKNIIKNITPQIVHAGWVQEAGFITALTKFHPFVLMPWGCDILTRPYTGKEQMNMTKYTLKKADKIICDCDEVRNKIIKLANIDKNKITVYRWGVDLDLFKPSPNGNILKKLGWEGKKVIISTRHFEKIYGLNYLAEAIPQIIKNNPDARFIFCGDGEEKDKILDIIKKAGVSEYVHFAGKVIPQELPSYLNCSDIYVSTSLSDGTSISLLEAFACGKPVAVTGIPSNKELVKDGINGFIMPAGDPKAVSFTISTLLKDSSLRDAMGQANRTQVEERFNWDKNFEIIEEVYKELV